MKLRTIFDPYYIAIISWLELMSTTLVVQELVNPALQIIAFGAPAGQKGRPANFIEQLSCFVKARPPRNPPNPS